MLADAPELVALLDEACAALDAVRGTLAPILAAAAAGRIARGEQGLSYVHVKMQLWVNSINTICDCKLSPKFYWMVFGFIIHLVVIL